MNSRSFFYHFKVLESHLDSFFHVNNTQYLRLFEDARWDFMTQNGYGLQTIQSLGLGPTILEMKIVFLKELRLREDIVIESKVLSYERKIGVLSQKMLRGSEVCCEAEFVTGLFDLNARKLVLPTEQWCAAVGVER